jgi:hypothetical protein
MDAHQFRCATSNGLSAPIDEAIDHSAVVVGWIGKPPARCRLAWAT